MDQPQSPFGDYQHQVARCETRLALSAMPWVPFLADSFDGFVEAGPLPERYDLLGMRAYDSPAPMEIVPHLAAGIDQANGGSIRSDYGLTGAGQTVAIIDSGIAYDHYALGRGYGEGFRVVGGWDFAENDNNPYDDGPGGYHGTHVAGIVGGDDGVRQGIAPNVDFVGLRVFDDYGKGQMEWTEAALRWVHENRFTYANPITTVNLSLGASWNSVDPPSWASLEDELRQLQEDGIVVVVSAGNSFQKHGEVGLAYPASSPFTIPVGSVDADGQISDFSQRDTRMLLAPGRGIESAVPDYFYGKDGIPNDWAKSSGTSMSTPFVTGASVLIREAMELAGVQEITPQRIYETMRDTANDVFDSVTQLTYKSLNIEAAIQSVLANVGQSTEPALPIPPALIPSESQTPPVVSLESNQPQFASLENGWLTIRGNANANNFSLDLSDGVTVGFDGAVHRWGENEVQRVTILGMENQDSVRITGSKHADKIEMRPGNLELTNAQLLVQIHDVENVYFAGGGGPDRAYLYDADTDDRLEIYPNRAVLTGVGYSFQVEQVDRIFVHALAGGDDQAFVYDSAGNDVLSARPQFTSMTGEGYFNYLSGFERVYAYSTQGGFDTAQLYDSAGNDLFSTRGDVSSLVGEGFSTFAKGFDKVDAYSIGGGRDRAVIHATERGQVSSGVDFVGLQTPQMVSVARNFQVIDVQVAGSSVNLVQSMGATEHESWGGDATRTSPQLPGSLGALATSSQAEHDYIRFSLQSVLMEETVESIVRDMFGPSESSNFDHGW